MGRKSNKRKRSQIARSHSTADFTGEDDLGVGATLAQLKLPDFVPFNLTMSSENTQVEAHMTEESAQDGTGEWHVVKKQKMLKKDKNHYPGLTYVPGQQHSTIRIRDLQNLVLYMLADGVAPQWISIKDHTYVGKVVVLMVPGLEKGMFDGQIALPRTLQSSIGECDNNNNNNGTTGSDNEMNIDASESATAASNVSPSADLGNDKSNWTNPDFYLPTVLSKEKLPDSLKPFADIFGHRWTVKAPGDDHCKRLYSPLHTMLNSPLPQSKEAKDDKNWKGPKSPRVEKSSTVHSLPVTSFLASLEQLEENDYVIHPATFESDAQRQTYEEQRKRKGESTENGWVDANIPQTGDGIPSGMDAPKGDLTAGHDVYAIDCEMCTTEDGTAGLTRVSILDWTGKMILDELVKPSQRIIDYLTPYSGITAEKLQGVTTTLQDIQQRLLKLFTPNSILIGHSLDSDLRALKFTHPYIIDTSIIFHHPRGPPLKASLKWLCQKFLGREIQKGHGGLGHDSTEDARACLDLVNKKCERGQKWGLSDAGGESIFKRLSRAKVLRGPRKGQARTTTAVEWPGSDRSMGIYPTFKIRCESDSEVADGVVRAVNGDPSGEEIAAGGTDFIWGRFRNLESVRGWWTNDRKPNDSHAESSNGQSSNAVLDEAVRQLTNHIKRIYESLPPCTLLLVFSGTGDPLEMRRLQEQQAQFKKEYKIKKWDELSVKWTDTEEQALSKAVRKAREGIAFMCIK